MTVIGEVCRAEDHHSIEDRQHLGLAARHVAIPQLQVSAVVLAPVLVQVEKEIQAPAEAVSAVLVEVGMNAQLPAAHDLMESATVKPWIGNQIRNSGHGAEELEEGDRI